MLNWCLTKVKLDMKLAIGTRVCKNHNWQAALGIFANHTNILNLPVDVDCVAADKFQCQGSSVLLTAATPPLSLYTYTFTQGHHHHHHRSCWSRYYFLPLLPGQIVQLNGNLLIYFPLMAARGLVLLSRPLYACSHTTVLWTGREWMLGFVNNNLLVLHIKSISFWKIWRYTYLVDFWLLAQLGAQPFGFWLLA